MVIIPVFSLMLIVRTVDFCLEITVTVFINLSRATA